ncbi:unnamed protein product [Thelazia callipaeda]|uniref:Uncharacterized protein n=1 Tax=Thelazia callipaeda TaxID=103827 RepID=A0A0N5DAX7_THECL|nr:unnamed protein product [Thelazia callipaeda]
MSKNADRTEIVSKTEQQLQKKQNFPILNNFLPVLDSLSPIGKIKSVGPGPLTSTPAAKSGEIALPPKKQESQSTVSLDSDCEVSKHWGTSGCAANPRVDRSRSVLSIVGSSFSKYFAMFVDEDEFIFVKTT